MEAIAREELLRHYCFLPVLRASLDHRYCLVMIGIERPAHRLEAG